MRTLHLVSHTHWDREWYLTFQQFRLKLVHLIDGLLDILEHDKSYEHFMLDGQTIVLDDYLLMRPEREADLRKYIRKGRILVGPWHILPDEFLVSPEATIRNLLQGERTCRKFGPKMMVGYIPDPFGHIGQMPQILRGFGIETACVQRGLSDQPCEFWWESPDGSRLFMAYLRDGYGNAALLPASEPERFTALVRQVRDNLAPHSAADHLLLMYGTDHMEPPPETSRAISAARGKLDGDKLIHSTLPAYLRAVQTSVNRNQLPVVKGELRDSKRSHLLPGVLSTRMWIKQRNRACETLMEKWAEPFSTFQELAAHENRQS
jgi:alpha-mannosidase